MIFIASYLKSSWRPFKDMLNMKTSISRLMMLLLSFLIIMQVSIVKADNKNLLLEQKNITILAGDSYDLNGIAETKKIKQLKSATIIISFTAESDNPIQTLFSVANSTAGNRDRHFHIYITNTGLLGIELRNTDAEFKYALNRPASLQGYYHGQRAQNTIAFKADETSQTYKLFANGNVVAELTKVDYKFLADISGLNTINLGATIREGKIAYPFGGIIHQVLLYDSALNDSEICQLTSQTKYGQSIFHMNDGTNSNYYRIPTLLTLKSGIVVASADARYGGTHDARSNIDIAFARSLDGGKTWLKPTLPLMFDDYAAQAVTWPRDSQGRNIQINGSAAFIDSVLLQDKQTERLFLFADAYPYGRGFNNSENGTGFKVIANHKYLQLRWHAEKEYNYTVRENGIIYDDRNNEPTEYSVDGDYRLLKNGNYLLQKQYAVAFRGGKLHEEKTNADVRMCVFYKDALFKVLPTNYLVYKYSDDDGVTWSDMKVMGDFRDVNKRMVLFGPGVGTQVQQGEHSGRLLISAYNSVSGDYGYLYSDDHGENWDLVNTDLGGSGNFAEAQIVELPDASLRTYMRTNSGKIGYITSLDGGMTWDKTHYINGINVPKYGTQLSVINYTQTIDGYPALILSTPTANNGRRHGQILVGLIKDTGKSGYERYDVDWHYRYDIDLPNYGYSYSCLTELPDGKIGLLYEKYDSWSRDELHLKDILRYETYDLSEFVSRK